MALFVLTIVVFLLFIPLSLYYAWSASVLWGWFIVPLFGLPQVSVLEMWGVMLFLATVRGHRSSDANSDAAAANFVSYLILPLLALGFGYALRFWWMA